MGLKGVLDAVKNNITSVPATNPTPIPRLACPWFLSYHNDWAIRAPREIVLSFFGAFAELRKTIISFVMSASPPIPSSVCPHGTTLLPTDGFSRNFSLSIFRKSVEKIQVSLKYYKNNEYFTWRPIYIFDDISLSFSWNDKCFRQMLYRKSKRLFDVQ